MLFRRVRSDWSSDPARWTAAKAPFDRAMIQTQWTDTRTRTHARSHSNRRVPRMDKTGNAELGTPELGAEQSDVEGTFISSATAS